MLKIIVAVFSVFGIAGFGKMLLYYWEQPAVPLPQLLSFAAGGLLFILSWLLYFSRRDGFWSTLEHELTHGLFALLFFKKIHSLSASRKKGGIITIEGGNAVIALAPYFFPLAAVIVLVVKPFLQSQYQVFMNFLLGFTYLFHLINLFREFHSSQPDLKESGYLFSIVLVFFLNLLFLGIIYTSLPGKWPVMAEYLKGGGAHTLQYGRELILFVYQYVRHIR